MHGHRHLEVVRRPSANAGDGTPRRRWLVVGARRLPRSACYVASLFQPWWQFTLYAPQYPQGLDDSSSRLTGVTGDVREIDMLNHYIGMAHLALAAPTERQLAG